MVHSDTSISPNFPNLIATNQGRIQYYTSLVLHWSKDRAFSNQSASVKLKILFCEILPKMLDKEPQNVHQEIYIKFLLAWKMKYSVDKSDYMYA